MGTNLLRQRRQHPKCAYVRGPIWFGSAWSRLYTLKSEQLLHPLTDAEHVIVTAGLRSADAITLRRCTERSGRVVDVYLFLAATFVVVRCLIQRARSRYRWPDRPTTRRLK